MDAKTIWVRVLWGLVVAILALCAAAFLFPVIAGNPTSPAKACLTNLKQLALATLMYTSDYDDRLPDRDAWMDVLQPYHKNKSPEFGRCPIVVKEFGVKSGHYGYAFNSKLSQVDLNKIKNPSETTMLFDSINYARNASDPLLSLPNPPRHGSKERKRNNVAFADGHVKGVEDLSTGEPSDAPGGKK